MGILSIRVHPWLVLSAALSKARTEYDRRSSFIVLRYTAQGLPSACLLWGPAHTLGEISLLSPCHRGSAQSPGPLVLCPSLQGPALEAPGKSEEFGGESGLGVEAGQLPLLLEVELEPRLGIFLRRKRTPHSGEKVWGQHPQSPVCPQLSWSTPDPCFSPPPPNLPVRVTHQVTKFYGGHGCLEDGPETPKEMGSEGIPERRGKQGVQSTRGITVSQRSNFCPTAQPHPVLTSHPSTHFAPAPVCLFLSPVSSTPPQPSFLTD